MPDRSLKPDELFRFVREHKTGKLFIALKQLDEEGTEPSLHDLCLQELRGMTEAHANIIIQQGRNIETLKKQLEYKSEVLALTNEIVTKLLQRVKALEELKP